ncbi:MAG TPA: TetR/AcrR family transcriptional regulator [Aggregatilineales bacterium]|nr:TetR/AcrR family transcriptional regulator [Aggregatilineales bacterium]
MNELDPRVRRTRQALREALVALILEQNYDTITIQDITERAGLRRATFYLHYHDKEELLLTILQSAVDGLTGGMEAPPDTECLMYEQVYHSDLKMFLHVESNASLYHIILGRQETNQIIQRVRMYIAAHIMQYFEHDPKMNALSLPVEVVANYMAGVKLAMISWWLEKDMPYSPSQMAEMCARLSLDGALTAVLPEFRANHLQGAPASTVETVA